jgi:hypothetical protein
MRTRTLLVMAGALILGVGAAMPAWGKAFIVEANISGPGLAGDGLRIVAPDTDGLLESGIDVAGGLDDTRADSIAELGLVPADLGPKYQVTYRFDFGPDTSDDLIRQDLYPYVKGGPVTHTPPGQKLTGERGMRIVPGWYESSLGFFRYLVDHGLPEKNPISSVGREPISETTPTAETASWAGIVLALVGLAALLWARGPASKAPPFPPMRPPGQAAPQGEEEGDPREE